MMLWIASLLATAIPLAASFPTYAIPKAFTKSFLVQASCSLPEGFEIHNFQTWTPVEGNDESLVVQFGYVDNSTGINTSCQHNSTSKNVGKPDLAPRYACDDPLAQFIWQNEILTMIETACPGATESLQYEASGSVKPETQCSATSCDYPSGDGTECLAVNTVIQGNFTSLQPSPP